MQTAKSQTETSNEASETTVKYYAVCNAGGPISVRLDGDTAEDARLAFEALDGRAAIDAASTHAEDDLDIGDAQDMTETEFSEAMERHGASYVADLEPIVNAHAGTVAHLADGWVLWSHESNESADSVDEAVCPVCGDAMPDQEQARRVAHNGIVVCAKATCEQRAGDR